MIDNLDNGVSAISIGTRYTGFFDCLLTIIDKEGFKALFNGVGALALQYTLQFSVLMFMRMAFDHLNNVRRASKYPSVVRPPPTIGEDRPPQYKPPESFGGLLQHSAFGGPPSSAFGGSPSTSSAFTSTPRFTVGEQSLQSSSASALNFPSFAQTQQHPRTIGGGYGPGMCVRTSLLSTETKIYFFGKQKSPNFTENVGKLF